MTLHMIRLDPDPTAVARWGLGEGLLRPGADDGYLWHALLAAVFGDHAPKPFRVVEREGRRPYVVGYGTADRGTLETAAAMFADPAVAEAVGLSSLAVKAMPTRFAVGARLGFEVRVRPIVRTTRNDAHGRPGREVDVFLAAAHRTSDPLDRNEVYRNWLITAMGTSVSVTTAQPIAIRRTRLLRRGRPDDEGRRSLVMTGREGGAPDVVFAGEMTVADPDGFAALLARGVGRHRAFGFGMLLLSPPGRGMR